MNTGVAACPAVLDRAPVEVSYALFRTLSGAPMGSGTAIPGAVFEVR